MNDKNIWEEQAKINDLNNAFNKVILKKQIQLEKEANTMIRTFGISLTALGIWMMLISFLLLNR